MKKRILTLLLLLSGAWTLAAQETFQYAQKDTSALYLDIWRPAAGAQTSFEGHAKPTVLFAFGGGFIGGERNNPWYHKWFQLMTEDGYTVVSIDYRLGMRGFQVGKGLSGKFKAVKRFRYSQDIGVEDVFSAISFLAAHPDLGIDTGNIVLSGSSAGAIITLAAVREIANGTAQGLPEGFVPRGAMSFAGAIISTDGKPKFKSAPCPLLLLHGTADQAVAYDHLGVWGKGLWGSSWIAEQLDRKAWKYNIWRFTNRTHDVASYMEVLWPLEKDFLEQEVLLGNHRVIDATVDDAALPSWGNISLDSIY